MQKNKVFFSEKLSQYEEGGGAPLSKPQSKSTLDAVEKLEADLKTSNAEVARLEAELQVTIVMIETNHFFGIVIYVATFKAPATQKLMIS